MLEEILHVLIHAIKETLIVLPAIFLVYILIELFEQKVGFFKNGKFLKNKGAPFFGAVAGIIPQCGISVMASKLYEKNLIKLGTLFSVFIATSDEALILLVTNGSFSTAGMVALLKLVFAIIIGFILNFILPKINTDNQDEIFSHAEVCAHHRHEEHDHEHEHGHELKEQNKFISFFKKYLLVPLKHSITTIIFVLALNIIFGFLVHFVGEDKITEFMQSTKYVQPLVVSLIGLIPNCASSVCVTQLYLSGGITFGSMFAGLVSNAGIGIAILFKNTKKLKRNLIIIVSMYLIAVALGYIVTLLELAF